MKSVSFIFILSLWVLSISCKKIIPKNTESSSPLVYLSGSNNDKVQKVEPTRDGGFIYCGLTVNNTSDVQAFLMKVDGNGKREWYHTYGDSSYNQFRDAIQCSDGGYVAVGCKGMVGITGSFITTDIDYVVKTDANGTEEWSKSFTSDDLAICMLTDVVESEDHFLYATGNYPSPTHWQDMFILKFDLDGNQTYYKGIAASLSYPPSLISDGDISSAWGKDIALDKNGNIFIGGDIITNNIPGGKPSVNIPAVIKLKPNGSVDFFYPYFNHSVSSAYASGERHATTKVICCDDGYYVTWNRDTITATGLRQCIELLKADLAGNPQWSKTYLGSGSGIVNDIFRMPDGSLWICGGSSEALLDLSFPEGFNSAKPYLLKLDANGNVLNEHTIDSKLNVSLIKCLNIQQDREMKGAGYTSLNDQGYNRMFFAKFHNDGKLKQ
jgi:hypothetical protein